MINYAFFSSAHTRFFFINFFRSVRELPHIKYWYYRIKTTTRNPRVGQNNLSYSIEMSENNQTNGSVNSVCLSLLLLELVPTAIRATHARRNFSVCTELQTQAPINAKLSAPDDSPGTAAIFSSRYIASEDTACRVGTYGQHLGIRIATNSIFKLPGDPKMLLILDIMKFLCRHVWRTLYGKQMDSLRTNHMGTFVLIDNSLRTISNLSSPNSISELLSAARVYLHHPCGIIQGVLKSFGIEASVSAEIKLFPTVEFNVVTLDETQGT